MRSTRVINVQHNILLIFERLDMLPSEAHRLRAREAGLGATQQVRNLFAHGI